MKRVFFINPYPHDKAPSQRLKYEQYYSYFRENGWQLEHSSFYDDKAWNVIYKKGHYWGKITAIIRGYLRRIADAFRLRKYDIIYIHLWVTPIKPSFFEWLYSKIARRIIYDIDDLVFLKADHIAWWKRMIKGTQKPVFLMKHSQHVITCTPYLDEFARKYNSNTTDISSTIDTDAYQPINSYSNDHKLILGWSGSHSTAPYMLLLTEALNELQQVCDFKLVVMGLADFNMPGIKDQEAHPWTAKHEIPTMQRYDIGLYPLPIADQWVMGKSGLKALQYMSLGIPTVATAVGANFRVIKDGETGFLVKDKEDWKEKLKYLMDNAHERRRIGTAARESVVSRYSLKANAPTYLRILDSVLSDLVRIPT